MSNEIEVKDQRAKGFFWVDDLIVDKYAIVLGATTLAVYVRLCRHADVNRKCFPSIDYLAESLGLSTRTVRRSLKDLQDYNIISAERIWRKGTQASNNTYTLLSHKDWKQVTPMSSAHNISEDEASDKNDTKGSDNKDKKQGTNETEAGDTTAPIRIHSRKDTHTVAPDGADLMDDKKNQETFSAQDWVDQLVKDKQAHIRLIGYYFAKYSEHHFPTKKVANDELRKNLKPAVYLLENYQREDITKTMKYCQEKFSDVHWNLSTVKKQIAYVTAKQ